MAPFRLHGLFLISDSFDKVDHFTAPLFVRIRHHFLPSIVEVKTEGWLVFSDHTQTSLWVSLTRYLRF
jgi:hypothetical protein